MATHVRHVEIDAEFAGQRLDNYLSRELRGVPRTLVYRLLRRGEVRVNGGRVKPAYRLQAGDDLRLPPVREGRGSTTEPSAQVLERLEQAVLHEDDELIVLNKPSGLAVHGGSGLGYGIIEAMRRLRPQCRFLDLAHRLDRDTSGCLVIAKRRSMLKAVHAALRAGEVDKRYHALLAGTLERRTQAVEARLERQKGRGGESVMRVSAAGKPARTVFHRERTLPGWTLVEAELHTGRMHQIRAHAAHMGHPVAGDRRYGDKAGNREARQAGLKRLFLHAASLTLPHGPLTVRAPLPGDLEDVLRRLDMQQGSN